MADAQTKITKEKFAALAHELETLKTARRKEVAETLEYAKSLGDLSENAEYHEARAAQAQVEDRIAKLEYTLKTAAIVDERAHTGGAVGIGSRVQVRREKDGKELEYTIVGTEEGDVSGGKVGIDSPLAQALLGKRVGDACTVQTPNGGTAYRVLAIS